MAKEKDVWGILVTDSMKLVHDAGGKLIAAEFGKSKPEQIFGWFETPEECTQAGKVLAERIGAIARWVSKHSPMANCGKCGAGFDVSQNHSALMIFRATPGGLDEEIGAVRFCPLCSGGIAREAKAVEGALFTSIEAPSTPTLQ